MDTVSSKQFSWNETSILIGGRIIEGVVDIEYTAKQETKPLNGRGNKPHRILKGNKTFTGKKTIWQSEFEAMVEAAPNKDALDLEFDIVWAHTPADGVGKAVVEVLKGCVISEYKKSMKQGDTNMLVELPFDFCDVKPQV
ncbi:hypothetical protein [Flavobacterium caeni]|uniref:Uncharacterized protein n=1 Tax=Flavobacterium caeni TaxID=490189 RepID=A0A1G5K296_9FLAO|nr:hypothetical protein [Flavobacterium caeni]SCY94707.1 hypothetical protein SAMN02927903_03047 [Flavobacterium caeni]